MHRRPLSLTGRRCACGALIARTNSACPKCRIRARWLRRRTYQPATDDQ